MPIYQVVDSSNARNYSSLISDLPPECLLEIYNYLPLCDQIKLSTLSQYFNNILILYYNIKKSLVITQHNIKDLNLIEIKENFINIGPSISSISITSSIYNFNIIFNLIIKYFPNLKYLNLYGIQLDEIESNKFFKLISVNFNKLISLNLDCCYFYNDNLNSMKLISRNLETMKLTSLKYFDGNYLNEFINLKYLTINYCTIKLEYFNKICETMKNLISFDIIECYIPLFNSSCFERISNNLINLEKLSIFLYYTDCNIYDMNKAGLEISKLNKLKHLIICGTDLHVIRFLDIISNSKLKNNLEILELPLYPEQQQLETLVTFKNLKELNFTNIYYTDIYINNYLILINLPRTMKILKMTCTYLTETWNNNRFWDFIKNSQKFHKFEIIIKNYGDYSKLKFVKLLYTALEQNPNRNYVHLKIDVTESEKYDIIKEINNRSDLLNCQFNLIDDIEQSEMD